MEAVGTNGGGTRGSRESRRRRIVDRGADRLAFITGQIKSLPSDSSFPASAPAPDPAPHEDVISGSSILIHETGSRVSESDDLHETVSKTEHMGRNLARNAADEPLTEKEQTSELQNDPERSSRKALLTTGEVYSAIAASENIRLWCSLAAAIFIVVTNMLGSFPLKSMSGFPPVYLLLVTSISSVMAKLIVGTRDAKERPGKGSISSSLLNGFSVVDQLGKSVEIVLLIQRVLGVLIMDFSVYALVLICGLSLLHTLGW